MNDNEGNIFSIVNGGKVDNEAQNEEDQGLPVNRYVLEDIDGDTYHAEGFLVFTAQHVAVMRDEGKGAIPVAVIPLTRCKAAGLEELFEDEDAAPF